MAGRIITRFQERRADKARAEGLDVLPLDRIRAATGLTWPTVKAWDSGLVVRAEFRTLAALCEYFTCDVCDLLEFVPRRGRK